MKKLTLLIISVISSVALNAQDIHYSQFFNSPQLVNPAFTGFLNGYERAILNHRSQWTSIGAPFKTSTLAFDMNLLKSPKKRNTHLGLGLNVFQDNAGNGIMKHTVINAAMSVILPVSKKQTLSVGLQGGVGNRSGDIYGLKWGNQYNGYQYDPNLSVTENILINPFWYPDMSFGFMYEFNNTNNTFYAKNVNQFQIGLAHYHAHRPKQKFRDEALDPLAPKTTLILKGRFDIPDTKFGIVPSFLGALQNGASEWIGGALVRYRLSDATRYTGYSQESSISAGVHCRMQDAVIMEVFYQISNYSIGISYDTNTAGLSTPGNGTGAVEITLQYYGREGALFQKRSQNRRRRR